MSKIFQTVSILITLIIFPYNTLSAQTQLSDAAEINLFTVGPWDGAVYAVYGHSAIQVKDDSTNVDVMFNYGYFDMSKPNFIYNFIRGKTDYILGATSYDAFIAEHTAKGLEIIKQKLHLTQNEKQNLWNALYVNALPENRAYRYNFLFDNCATRPRDMIEKYVTGTIVYPDIHTTKTFRDLIHECVQSYPWMQFGIDLVIGAPADTVVTLREEMFLPEYLMKTMDDVRVIKNDSTQYQLVAYKETVAESTAKAGGEQPVFTPKLTAFAVLLLSIIVSFLHLVLRRTRIARIYDTLLFGTIGIGGLIIYFLMFFSVHPAVSPNWNFAWMNVFALLFAILFWVPALKNLVTIYHFINFFVLTLFIALWWLLPQYIPWIAVIFAASLWIRSGVNLLWLRRRVSKRKRFPSSRDMKAGWGA